MWYGGDPLFEKYPDMSPYVYCAGNPVKFIDPNGREFDEANEKIAKEIESNINAKILELQEQQDGQIVQETDISDRISELQKSKTDISDMRNKKGVKFHYKSANDESNPAGKGNPTIEGLDTESVIMYVEDNMESKLHEGRHGGDVARGSLTYDTYCVNHEVSAYKAQYSYQGSFDCIPYIDYEKNPSLLLQMITKGVASFKQNITNMKEITPSLIKNLVDQPGVNQKLLYPQFK